MYDTVVISKSVFQQATILFGVGPLARRYLLCTNFPKKKKSNKITCTFVQTQFILRVVNKEGLYVRYVDVGNIVFYVAIYSTDFRKPRGNSASIASNKYSKPAQSKEAMNIQQQQITLEIA